MTGQIILLHGASSSGKSTLAQALQSTLPDAFWHMSIDHLRDGGVLPMYRYRSGDLSWASDRLQIFETLHQLVATTVAAGNNVIFEHILDSPEMLDDVQSRLAGLPVLFVGVQCPLDVLRTREKIRANRPSGSAARDFEQVHTGMSYDLQVSGTDKASANATLIAAALRTANANSALFRSKSS